MSLRYENPAEANYIDWVLQQSAHSDATKELASANFQDIFNLTRRSGDVEVRMSKIKYRAQGVGGMIGIAAGAMGGPLGSVIGFGIGRAVGSFFGNGLAKKYYGAEQMSINENLYLARQRDSQLKLLVGIQGGLSEYIGTLRQNNIKQDEKILQDMIVL